MHFKTQESSEDEIKIIECICAWYDLLGFGQPLVNAKWDLNEIGCYSQLARIRELDLTFVNTYSSSYGTTTLNLNDGVVINYDIEEKSESEKIDVLRVLDDIILEYEILNQKDSRAGHPGVRGIITFGHRYNYLDIASTVSVSIQKTVAYHPKELQMNTAFSKAYIMESSGSKAGIQGNHLYIDGVVLNFIEKFLANKKLSPIYKIDKNLDDQETDFHFTIYKNDEVFLKLYFEKIPISYKHKGIETLLYKYNKKDSLRQQLAEEAEYHRAMRYSQMEDEDRK